MCLCASISHVSSFQSAGVAHTANQRVDKDGKELNIELFFVLLKNYVSFELKITTQSGIFTSKMYFLKIQLQILEKSCCVQPPNQVKYKNPFSDV